MGTRRTAQAGTARTGGVLKRSQLRILSAFSLEITSFLPVVFEQKKAAC
jgi:hypothetical protein